MENTIRLLQQRIDLRANLITYLEACDYVHDRLAYEREEQAWDKRVMGVSVQVRRERNAARKREG